MGTQNFHAPHAQSGVMTMKHTSMVNPEFIVVVVGLRSLDLIWLLADGQFGAVYSKLEYTTRLQLRRFWWTGSRISDIEGWF